MRRPPNLPLPPIRDPETRMPGKPDMRRRTRRGRDDAAWPVVLSSVLLAGAVAAAVSAAMLRFGPDEAP